MRFFLVALALMAMFSTASGENGQEACEGKGLNQQQCTNVGCCAWDDGECWSAVETNACENSGANSGDSGNSGNNSGCSYTLGDSGLPTIVEQNFVRNEAFGIPVWSETGITTEQHMHVVKILASYLDGNGDGCPDDVNVSQKMLDNKALFMVLAKDPMSANAQCAMDWADSNGYSIQPQYGFETNANCNGVINYNGNCRDATYEEVFHLVQGHGLSSAYPNEFGTESSKLTAALDVARGGHYQTVPSKYPENAFYTYSDKTCEYDCQNVEYWYFAQTSILGMQSVDSSGVCWAEHEWKYCTPQEVQDGDPLIWDLLVTNPPHTMTMRVPDSNYNLDNMKSSNQCSQQTTQTTTTAEPTEPPTKSPTISTTTTAKPSADPTEALPEYQVYLTFEAVRDCDDSNSVSVSEIQFYDAEENLLTVESDRVVIENGDSPGGEPLSKAFDDSTNTKWLDFNLGDCGGSVTLELYVSNTAVSYTFFTSNDGSERDPTAWTMSVCDGDVCSDHTMVDVAAPTDRKTSYGLYEVFPTVETSPAPTTTTTTADPTPTPTTAPTTAPTPTPTATTTTTTMSPDGSLTALCGCVAQYEFCDQECSSYTSQVSAEDTVCQDAFVNVVCVDGVDGSFFGTPYYSLCPSQCPMTCDSTATTDVFVQCLKSKIEVLEYRVDGLESSNQEQGDTITELKGQCDAVQEALGTCGSQ